MEKVLTSINAELKSEKTVLVGEDLKSEFFTVVASYNNGSTEEVAGVVGAFDKTSIGAKTVEISYTQERNDQSEETKTDIVSYTAYFANDGYYVLGLNGNWGDDTYKLTENTENAEEMMIKGVVVDGENDTIKIVSQFDGVLTYYNEVKQGVKAQYTHKEENIAFINGTYDLYFDLLRKALWVDVTLASIEAEFIGSPITENTVSLSPEMLKVTAHYSDGTSETVTGFEIGEHDFTTYGTKTVTITYGGKSDDEEIEILRKALTSIDAELKSGKTVLLGDTLEPEDFTVIASYNNGKTAEVTGVVGEYIRSEIGVKTVEISYAENGVTMSDTVTYTVYFEDDGYYLLGINDNWGTEEYKMIVNSENTDETIALGVTSDEVGDEFKIIYQNDGTITYYSSVKSNVNQEFYDQTSADGDIALKQGNYDIYFDTATKFIYIGYALESISATYHGYNGVVYQDEELNLAEITVEGTYYDNSKKAITAYNVGELDSSTLGTTYVEITYRNKTTSMEVEIKVAPKRTIHYYNVNGWNGVKAYAWSGTGEDKVEYFGLGRAMTADGDDWFSIDVDERATGIMFINAEYESAKTEELTIDVDKVYYNFKKEWVAVKPTLDRIEATYSGDKVTVELDLDETKISVTAHYSDGMTKGIDVFTVSGFDNTDIREQDVTVTYEYFNETEYTDTIEVEVIDKVLLSIEAQPVKQDKIVVGYELKATDFKVLAYFNNSDTPVDVTNESTVVITCDTSSIDTKVATVSYTYPSVTVLELVTKSYDVNVTVYFENDGYYIIGMDGNNGSDDYAMVRKEQTTEYMYKVLDINSDDDKIKIVYQNGDTLTYYNTLKDGVTTNTGATVNVDGYIELNKDQYDLYLDTVSGGIWIEYSLDSITAVYNGVVYQNEELDVSKITVTAIYNDSLHKVLDENDYEIGTFSSATLGTTTVVISYNGKTADMNVNIEVAPTRTLYYYNENNWNTVYAYAWSGTAGNDIKYLGSWPGTEMTEDVGNNGWFSIVVDERATTIIFNDRSTNQTAELEINADNIYFRNKIWNATRLTEIRASYEGTSVVVGMDLNKSDIKVTAYYSDETNEPLDVNDFEIDKLSSAEAGNIVITVTYDNETATTSVPFIPVAVSSITASLKEGETIYAGDTLSPSQFIITAFYNNDTDRVLGEDDFANIELEYNITNAGEATVNVKFTENNVEQSFGVQVEAEEVVLNRITATFNNDVAYVGDTLTANDFTVKEIYNNGDEITVNENITVTHGTLVAGNNQVTVNYNNGEEYTAEVTVSVVEVALDSITASIKQETTVYVGDTLDSDMFIVTAFYNNGTHNTVSENITFNVYNMENAGNVTIKVTYTENEIAKFVEVEITVVALEVTKIEASLNNGFALVDYEFSVNDFTVTATYNNGTTGTVTGTLGDYDNSKVGNDKKIVISYGDLESEVTYNVFFEEDGYYVLGIDGNWGTTSYKMSENTADSNEMMIMGVTADGENDAIKVVKQENGTLTFCGKVEEGNESMYDDYEENTGNIILKALTYDIYYKINENEIYLAQSAQLTGITASLKNGFALVGEVFTQDSFTVIASYDNETTAEVTDFIIEEGYDNSVVEQNREVTIRYRDCTSIVQYNVCCEEDGYYIMGMDCDIVTWGGIRLKMTVNPENENQMMYTIITIDGNDYIKVVHQKDGVLTYHQKVNDEVTVEYTQDQYFNLIFANGTYNLYFDTTTNEIYIEEVLFTGITASLNNDEMIYTGDTVTSDMFTVYAIYNNGTQTEVTEDITVDCNTSVAGTDITATITYNDGNTAKSITVTVTVIQLEVTAIQASLKDTNVRPKDVFTEDSFTVMATYNNDTEEELTDFEIGVYDNSGVGTNKTITITYEECTSTITYDALFAEDGYYILGVDGDWGTAAYKMSANPANLNEVMYTGLKLSGNNDAVKVVKQQDGEINYFANIKDEVSITYSNDGNGNLVLAEGTYDFYFDTTKENDKALHIGKTMVKVSFKNTGGWSNVYAYAWKGAGNSAEDKELGEWPGTEMTDDGDGWYSINVSVDAEKIIFTNNAGDQTDNLTIDKNEGYYYNDGNWQTTK